MSTVQSAEKTTEIYYPESDGKPMAETDVHRDVMSDMILTLKEYFRDRPDVYVAGNLLLYYEKDDARVSVAPDVFVTQGIPNRQRRVYKLWEEKRPPDVVWEISSRSTRFEDLESKRVIYARIGVQEYFLFDPLEEYLQPSLQAFRLVGNTYQPVEPDSDGWFAVQTLGLKLRREGENIRLAEVETGKRLLRPDELAEAQRLAETQAQYAKERAEAEAAARLKAEAEIERLKAEIERLRGEQ